MAQTAADDIGVECCRNLPEILQALALARAVDECMRLGIGTEYYKGVQVTAAEILQSIRGETE